ncbi:hypothetical protein JB92DRAFT_3106297 [Gautieria morchelliformis]|nr:hypothetical protein JB92DRAFT_3106297 [Gautieria morchelliformis]
MYSVAESRSLPEARPHVHPAHDERSRSLRRAPVFAPAAAGAGVRNPGHPLRPRLPRTRGRSPRTKPHPAGNDEGARVVSEVDAVGVATAFSVGTKTVINHNPLPDMTHDEFVACLSPVLAPETYTPSGPPLPLVSTPPHSNPRLATPSALSPVLRARHPDLRSASAAQTTRQPFKGGDIRKLRTSPASTGWRASRAGDPAVC